MMSFTPRLDKSGMEGSVWYYSGNKFYSAGYGLPNCTCYAYGRYAEIRGAFADNLPGGNATTWYDSATSFKRGGEPQLGSIICWSSKSGNYGGHVAVVEKIDSNGDILVSNSGYTRNPTYMDANYFFLTTYTASSGYYNGNHGGDYYFRGFIYNDAVSESFEAAHHIFVENAKSHIGEGPTWTCNTIGLAIGQPWCDAFVRAVAKQTGILNKIISSSGGAGSVMRDSVKQGWGIVVQGPGQGFNSVPRSGDLIGIRWGNRTYDEAWKCDHIGIVENVTDTSVNTIEGNRGGAGPANNKVAACSYDLTDKRIWAYYQPDWSLVGDTSALTSISVLPSVNSHQPLYTTKSTKEDATLREVLYYTSALEPSIKTTNMKLSVVNYTSVLAALVDSYGGFGSTSYGTPDNIDGLPSVPRTIVEYLINKGLPTSTAIGIIANIRAESEFNTNAVGDGGTSFGLCQWHFDRGTAMKQMAGPNWATNLSGQLDYLWYELSTGKNWDGTLDDLKMFPNTEEGARMAADYFLRKFEKPDDIEGNSKLRQRYASEYWSMIVVNTTSSQTTVQLVGSGAGDTRYIYNWLSSKLSKNGAIAIMAAMANETGWTYDPDLVELQYYKRFNKDDKSTWNGYGYGLLGWTNQRGLGWALWDDLVNWCSENNLRWSTVEGQLNYLNHELNDIAYYRNALPSLKTGTLYDAMKDFFTWHQGGGSYFSSEWFINTEYGYAQQIEGYINNNDWTFGGKVNPDIHAPNHSGWNNDL